MRIKINGQERDFPDGADIHAVLAAHKLTPDKVAIEVNRRLVRSDKYGIPLNDGDEIEIVTFVGGG